MCALFFVRWSCRLKSRLFGYSICLESVWLEYGALRLATNYCLDLCFEEEFREHSEKKRWICVPSTRSTAPCSGMCVQIIRVSAFDGTRNTIQCKLSDELKMSRANERTNERMNNFQCVTYPIRRDVKRGSIIANSDIKWRNNSKRCCWHWQYYSILPMQLCFSRMLNWAKSYENHNLKKCAWPIYSITCCIYTIIMLMKSSISFLSSFLYLNRVPFPF